MKTIINRIALIAIMAVMSVNMKAQLPDGAINIASALSYELYVVGDDAPGARSLWIQYNATKEVKCLLQTSQEPLDFSEYAFNQEDGKVMPANAICSISNAFVYPGANCYVVLEGCPDSRNIYTFIYDVRNGHTIHLPTNNGFIGFTNEDTDLLSESYDYYPQGGRYSVVDAYDINGKHLSTMRIKHEQ